MATEGYLDFIAGTGLAAADLENFCELQSIMRFASAAARDTALATLKTEGMVTYQKDVNRYTYYDGSNWLLVAGSLPRVSATKNTTQSIANNSATAITFPDTEDYDTDAMHDTSTNTSRLTIPSGMPGVWRVGYSLYWASGAAAGKVQTWMAVNGAAPRYGWQGCSITSGDDAAASTQHDVVLSAADYVEIYGFQVNTGAGPRSAGVVGLPSRFWATYMGPN